MPDRRIDYGSWVLRVLTWDAVLPLCVALIPIGIGLILPNRRGAIELTSVTVPIAAFGLRLRAGKRQIESNACTERVRRFQFCIFVVGVLPLILIDAFLILTHVMPKFDLSASPGDLMVCAVVLAFYLLTMTIAMYPGTSEPKSDNAYWE